MRNLFRLRNNRRSFFLYSVIEIEHYQKEWCGQEIQLINVERYTVYATKNVYSFSFYNRGIQSEAGR